jgi:hypothetical protein
VDNPIHLTIPRHHGSVLLAYIDESYEPTRFVLSAVVVDGDSAHADTHRWHLARARVGEGLPGSNPRLDRIVDALHFSPSHASRLLQAADVVAYVSRRVGSSSVRSDRAIGAAKKMAHLLDGCLIGSER